MEKDLRVLHQDDAGDPVRLGHIRFQERQHIDAPHAFAQVFHRSLCPPFFIAGCDRNGKHLVCVTVYGAADVKVCSYKGKKYCYPEYDSVSALCDKQEKADFNTVYQAAAKAAKEQL